MTETQQLLSTITQRITRQDDVIKTMSDNISKLTDAVSDIKTLQANQHHLDSRLDAHLATEKELEHRVSTVEKNQILLSEFVSNAKKFVWIGITVFTTSFIGSFLLMYQSHDNTAQKEMAQAIEKLASSVNEIKKSN